MDFEHRAKKHKPNSHEKENTSKLFNEKQHEKLKGEKRCKCSNCHLVFKDLIELAEHFQSIHEG